MEKIVNRHKEVTSPEFLRLFEEEGGNLHAKYGLPNKVAFCKKCIISNQRPNSAIEFKHTKSTKKRTIGFNEDGICDACLQAERKKQAIDWKAREEELIELCDRYRRNDGRYDCLVPGSGGKDSFYASHVLKEKYGMHPLTVTWAPHIHTPWGWRNFQAWVHAGFDNYMLTPNGRVHRLLTRLAVENLFHPFQPFMLGQKTIAPKIATLMDIPLVFYGENEAEYGNPISDNDSARRSWEYFTQPDQSSIYISGVSIQDLKSEFGLKDVDLEPYLSVDPILLEKKGIDVHYLGYYIPWHPQGAYYYSVEHGGFEASPERTAGTYSKYNSIDDKIDDFHFYSYYIKFGIGRATYDASQEVRNEDITREEGVALVKKYDGEFPERFAKEIFNYLSLLPNEFPVAHVMFEQTEVDRQYFDDLVDSFRSPHLWKRENGAWKLRHAVWHSEA
ncbi:MAG: N-acetyl sugar amidotransferase [Desulfamplus sp.]|nr:N-acetyl sugar amidotransferase [Desulfamplus sp.]